MATAQHDSIRQSLGVAWSAHLDSIHQHLPATLAGIDSEELHQLRVALRKTRALLRLFRKTLPQAERFKDDFKWLAAATGEVRDLDVLIMHAQRSTATLGVTESHATPIIGKLRRERVAAQKKLGATLRGQRSRDLLEHWRQFLAILPTRTDLSPAADVPASTTVALLVIEQSRRLLQEGLIVGTGTDPHELHELRIRGKRLRYLLESFDDLIDLQRMEPLGRKLRKLQTVLGGHQDAVVAAERWQTLAKMLRRRGDANAGALALLDEWTTEAKTQQLESREALAQALAKFARACRHL